MERLSLWERSTCGGQEKSTQRFGRETLRERDHFEDPNVDGWVILKWIFKKWDGAWIGLIWLRIETGVGFL